MKKQFNPAVVLRKCCNWILAFVLVCISQNVLGQEGVQLKSRDVQVTKQKTNDFNEAELRAKMKADGLSDPVIDKLIAQRKVWMQRGKNVYWTNVKNNPNPKPNAACNAMGVDNGSWGAWQGDVGSVNSGAAPTWTPPPGLPAAPNFSLTSGSAIDPNTPSVGNPAIQVSCPGFGGNSIQLGEMCVAGCVAEQLTYPLTVTAQDTNFVYAYAIVIEDAGHSVPDQPFVEFCIYDQAGNQIPCGCFRYTGGPTIGGFFPVSGNGCAYAGLDQYKPWTLVGVNLSNYVGQTLNVVITNVDCAQCGHWAYSYWDFICGTASLSAGCVGNQSTICGPVDPNIAYTYQWYQNGNMMSGSTQQCITVTPQPGDTFSVLVHQPSGCDFVLGYAPAVVIPDFTHTGQCGNFTFIDSSTVTPSSASATGWNWSFPGGTPSTGSTQSVSVSYTSPGNYAVTLTVTISAGCSAVITHTVNVTALPTAAFTSSPPCLGGAVTLTDGSISPAGDPIVSWSWSMPGGNPPTATGPTASTSYGTSGAHTVTLTVTTAQGCTNAIPQQVIVYTPPVATFTGSATGCAPICGQFTDQSTSQDGNITSWSWTFPGGNPSSSTQQNPYICYNTQGQYGATLIITSQYGCKDTVTITPLITVYPWPNADFCVTPAQASITDPSFVFCDLWTSDVTQWSWNFGDGDSDIVNTDPAHSYASQAINNDFYNFNVCLKVKNPYGCWDTICKPVEIIPEFTFYIPNTFTPNSDNMNEMFYGKGKGIKEYFIWIFDRWGNQVWDCHFNGSNVPYDGQGQEGMSATCKWDGEVVSGGMDMSGSSGQLAQEDVYVWKVKLTDVFDRKHTYVGNVNVVR